MQVFQDPAAIRAARLKSALWDFDCEDGRAGSVGVSSPCTVRATSSAVRP